MGRIGFVTIGHSDYLDDTTNNFIKSAIKIMHKTGHTIIVMNDPVVNSKTAHMTGTKLTASDLDGVVVFLASWMECPFAISLIMEVAHLPLCLWGFPMFPNEGGLGSTGSYVSYAMLKGVLDRIQHKYIGILGSIESDEVYNKLNSFCTASECRQKLRRSKIGLVGYASMGIYTGTFDHVFMHTVIGPEVEHIDSYTVIEMAKESTENVKKIAIEKFKKAAEMNSDISKEILSKTAGVYCGLKKCIEDRDLNGINVKCQYEFSKEYKCVPCVPLSLLADEGTVSSCEGDMLCTVSMMILNYLSKSVTTYGDVMHHYDNTVKLSSCGFIPFSMGCGKKKISNFLPHPGFTGIQPSFVLQPQRVTVLRLIEEKCDYKLLYFIGTGLVTDLRQGYMPALDIRLDGDINKLIDNYSGQHYAICYGDMSLEIETLSKIMGIKSVKI